MWFGNILKKKERFRLNNNNVYKQTTIISQVISQNFETKW